MGYSPSLFPFLSFLVSPSFFHLIFLASFAFVQPLCHDDERFALMKFKESFTIDWSKFEDPSACPKVSLWKPESGDCCRWRGVKCNEDTGHVIGIDLSSSCLYGSINSSSSLFQLVHLQSLNLAYNHFNDSQIPTGFRQLSRLTSLNLSWSAFSGQINSEIFELSNLSSLDLSWSSLELQKPGLTSIARKLTNLKELDLSGVGISSTVPNILANLSSLTSLILSYCGLHGEFPTGIFHLPNLRSLDLDSNINLTGSIPEFNRSSHLELLVLTETRFSGELPGSIGKLKSLNHFDADECNFFGPMPPSLGNLVNLEFLDLSSNHLSGTVEFDLFLKLKNLIVLGLFGNNISLLTKTSTNTTLPKFKILDLGSCDLSEFPDFLKNQDELLFLDLSHNKIHGQIPRWMWNVSKETLSELRLNSNSLTGSDQLPVFPTNIVSLDLSSNKLRGSLPIPPPSIEWYSFSNNALTGEIPQLICNLKSIYLLDLSSNNLSGFLPQCLGNLSDSLSVLNLHDNNFHGTIPDTFVKGNKLKMIDFSQNQLQGRLPRSLANCTILESLNLGNNQLNDTFPSWLGILPMLSVLILRSNGIYGAMENPNSSFDFPNIRIIDLSHNEIAGELPSQYFENWKAMQSGEVYGLGYMQLIGYSTYSYSMTFTNKGTNLVYERILVFFMAIDLSSNKFEGEIPEAMGHLKGLKLLNLSNNFLTGPISSCLGNLTELESLDLSQNKLDGVIPSQLAQLTFLESFNVSHNLLTGPIPQGNQFGTFPNSSFGNNPELCGSPLSKKCRNSKDAPLPPLTFEGNQSSESLFDFSWKVVAMGYGCGFMVGLVLWQIMIRKKHDWVIKTFAIGQPKPRMVNWRRGRRN